MSFRDLFKKCGLHLIQVCSFGIDGLSESCRGFTLICIREERFMDKAERI